MKIIIATGGSGGHIFPALKTAQQLRGQGHEILFVGALRFAEDHLKQAGFPFVILNVEGLNTKSPLGIFLFFYLMIRAVSRSVSLLCSFKPQAVAGFGSYSSFPVVLAARLLGIPALVHEQNVIPGRANRFSFRWARRVAVTFEETKHYVSNRDIVWTGCPCNSRRSPQPKADLLASFNLRANRKTILVLGGSQGSRYLNEVFFEAVPYLQADCNIQVIHMTGRTDFSLYDEKYRSAGVPYHVCSFLNNIEDAYSVADVVIARAGAGTVCEIAAFGLSSVLVPYPFAGAHQRANAAVLERAGTAIVIEQKDLTRATLIEAINRLDKVPAETQRADDSFIVNPTERLAEAIVSLNS